MKSKVKIFVVSALLMVITLGVASAQGKITLKGHVQFEQPGAMMEVYKYDGSEKITVATFDVDKDNNFNYELKIEDPGLYHLDCMKWESVSFWAEDEDIEVNFRGRDTARMIIKNPLFHQIKGGPKNEVINHLNYVNHRNYQMMIAISQTVYRSSFTSDKDKDNANKALFEALSKDYDERISFLANLYSDRTSVLAILQPMATNYDRNREQIEMIFDNLLNLYPNYQPALKLKERIARNLELKKKMEVGVTAPDFSYPTLEGKSLGPKDFRGKVLLIDFWASWCGPCRAEIPNLKEAYAMYKDKGVEFLSVSIDKKPEDWKKALTQEEMPWPQILAPNSGKEITELYQFSGIPFIVLIDKNGRLVGKNLRGQALKEAIEEQLKR